MPRQDALIVGIDDYGDSRWNLEGCVRDAQTMADVLRTEYNFQTVRTLLNAEATVEGLDAALDELFRGATAEDRLVFYYSGHGTQYVEGNQLFEALALHGLERFEDHRLTRKSHTIPPGVLTVVLDSCFSGGMLKPIPDPTRVVYLRGKALGRLGPPMPGVVYKPFAFTPAAESLDVASNFGISVPPGVGGKSDVEPTIESLARAEGALQLNGGLFAAALAHEEAYTMTPGTQGLSAFTFGLLSTLRQQGWSLTPRLLRPYIEFSLIALGLRQSPQFYAPVVLSALVDRPLFPRAIAPFIRPLGPAPLEGERTVAPSIITPGRDTTMTEPDNGKANEQPPGDRIALGREPRAGEAGAAPPPEAMPGMTGEQLKAFLEALLSAAPEATGAVVAALSKALAGDAAEPALTLTATQAKGLHSLIRMALSALVKGAPGPVPGVAPAIADMTHDEAKAWLDLAAIAPDLVVTAASVRAEGPTPVPEQPPEPKGPGPSAEARPISLARPISRRVFEALPAVMTALAAVPPAAMAAPPETAPPAAPPADPRREGEREWVARALAARRPR